MCTPKVGNQLWGIFNLLINKRRHFKLLQIGLIKLI